MSKIKPSSLEGVEILSISEDNTGIDPKRTKSQVIKNSIDKVVQPVVDNMITKVEDVSEKVIEATTKLNQLSPKKKHMTLEEKKINYLTAAIIAIDEYGPSCSMEQIAAQAGVSKPIIYKVFKDRDGLIAAVSEYSEHSITSEVNKALTYGMETIFNDPRAVITSAIYAYVCFMEQNQNLYFFLKQNLSKSTLSNSFVTIIAKQVSVSLDEFLHHYNMDTGPAELWGNSIIGMVGQATEWWIEHKILSRQRMVDYLVNLIWSGFEGIAIDSGVNIYSK